MQNALDPPDRALRVTELDVDTLPEGSISRLKVEVVADGLANAIVLPVLVARGRRPGPVFGLTAAVHGNELNGIRLIHDVFERIDVNALRGTVAAVVAINVPGLHWHQREFIDGTDLNHIFPGRPHGSVAQVYAHRVIDRVIRHFDFLVDLHTASFGRVNSLYVRADMTHPKCSRMAYLQRPQIIVHNPPNDHTLRGAAMGLGIPAITVEIGDPQRFQPNFIRNARIGLRTLLADAHMLPRRNVAPLSEPLLCERSYWMYTDHGGLLEVLPESAVMVKKGDRVAVLRNAFGDIIREYAAPEDGVVVGRSVNPVGQTGARIIHLGVVAPEDHNYFRREPLVSRLSSGGDPDSEAAPSSRGGW